MHGDRSVLGALVYAIGGALVAVFSYGTAAQLPGIREAYWAPLAALMVVYPARKATMWAGFQYLVATAIGSVIGWACVALWRGNLAAYGAGVMLAMGASYLVRCRAAARWNAVAVTIVAIVPHPERPHLVALLRFLEVSYGIACALAYTYAADFVVSSLKRPARIDRRAPRPSSGG